MRLNDYQDETERTAPPIEDTIGCLINFSMGLSGESGEVTDHIKKVAFHGHDLDAQHIAKELGDILWYVSRTAETLGFTLEEIATMNIEKLKKRYPDGFNSDDSINRKE